MSEHADEKPVLAIVICLHCFQASEAHPNDLDNFVCEHCGRVTRYNVINKVIGDE